MPPTTTPESKYWRTWLERAILLLGRPPLPVYDLHHGDGAAVQSIMVRRREVEDAGDPDEVPRALDGVADRTPVVPRPLHGAEDELDGIPGMPAERIARAMLGLKRLGVGQEHGLLRVGVRKLLGHQELAHGEDHPVG